MTKFDLKKIIAENKATFFSSLDEDKKEYYKKAEADDAEHIDALEKDMKDDKKLSEAGFSPLKANSFSEWLELIKKTYPKIAKELENKGLSDIKKIDDFAEEVKQKGELYNEDRNLYHIPGTEIYASPEEVSFGDYGYWFNKDRNLVSTEKASDREFSRLGGMGLGGRITNENQTTMTKESLKAKIKEMILAELNEENIDIDKLDYDFLPEAKKEDEEATDAPEATDIEVSAEETPTSDSFEVSTSEVDPTVKAIQDALTQAQAAAQKLGDEKLTDQIGNTITFFTRTHVANKDVAPVAEQLDEAFINKLKHRAGIIK